MYVLRNVCMYAYMYVCMYVCMYVAYVCRMYVCMKAYIMYEGSMVERVSIQLLQLFTSMFKSIGV